LHGDPDSLSAEPSKDALAELVLNEELIGERLHVTGQGEIE
jgi:hypothetical protein